MAIPPFPILIIAPPRRAEAVQVSGLIRRLGEEAPNADFTIVGAADVLPLFAHTPRLEQLIAQEDRGLLARLSLWRKLRSRRWGLILDLGGSGGVPSLSAKRRAVLPSHDRRGEHLVVRAGRLFDLQDDPPPPFLFTTPEIEARANELLEGEGPLLAIAPGAPWIGAAWPTDRFARTASQLLADDGPLADGRLVVVGSEADWTLAQSVRRSFARERWVDLTGETDPLVVYACLKRARLFIGLDSWHTQMAAAAGVATLGLYGPADEAVAGPWGRLARAVRGPRGVEQIRAVDPELNQPVCHMLDLPVETVVDAALRLLEETRPPKRTRVHA